MITAPLFLAQVWVSDLSGSVPFPRKTLTTVYSVRVEAHLRQFFNLNVQPLLLLFIPSTYVSTRSKIPIMQAKNRRPIGWGAGFFSHMGSKKNL